MRTKYFEEYIFSHLKEKETHTYKRAFEIVFE